MADIELVIKIPEEIRLALINNIQLSPEQQSICVLYIKQAMINGTPLPKMFESQEFCELEGQDKENYQKALDRMYKPTGMNVESLLEPCEDVPETNVGNIDKVDAGFYIAQICAYFAIQKRKYGYKVYDELFDHACKLEEYLENNSSTEDCISRQAVLDLIENYNSDGLGSVFYGYEQGVKFADAVNKLYPVNPKELKTGAIKGQPTIVINGSVDARANNVQDAWLQGYAQGVKNTARKTGHWIKISPAGIYECSECGQNVMTSDICAYKFCHGCGAKMEDKE